MPGPVADFDAHFQFARRDREENRRPQFALEAAPGKRFIEHEHTGQPKAQRSRAREVKCQGAGGSDVELGCVALGVGPKCDNHDG